LRKSRRTFCRTPRVLLLLLLLLLLPLLLLGMGSGRRRFCVGPGARARACTQSKMISVSADAFIQSAAQSRSNLINHCAQFSLIGLEHII
jgi:hypothetical protein